ncbi:xylulokinase [Liquorilactobacillus vini]|uniref:xylulokinase n=1 Tax=Liquorilactobacillus vini TaxID=238015 RepID=UPI00029B104F|nr:FGGY-family carbohydrate kinase [Liquorilactobacillus vini]
MDLILISKEIQKGQTCLGIELGSTRIKAVLTTNDSQTITSGDYTWENKLEDGVWTYSLDEVWKGIQSCYAQISADVQSRFHASLTKIGAIGVSAMMHGYLPFSKTNQLLVPFRTWRNNMTEQAADKLTDLFDFNVPQRWSIAHLYQAILNNEAHVKDIDFITTLAGYVHWQLSGEKVLGIGDASGMFPIDNIKGTFSKKCLEKFSSLAEVRKFNWKVEVILPQILQAGQVAGKLTIAGSKRLDPSGILQPGSLMAPPEGDAGTGMVATNSVRQKTGNISVGTSAFSMIVLDKPLKKVHKDIDVVATPVGSTVAMVHINNCTSDINSWVRIFKEFAERLGIHLKNSELYENLLLQTTKSDNDAGGVISYGYLSGENITRMPAGRPLVVRKPESKFNLANFMLAHLYSAFAPLKIGMDILMKEENVKTNVLIAQGGLFKTPVIAQQVLADALETPITIMKTADEGGPWGMAVLAAYVLYQENNTSKKTLSDFLDQNVFINPETMTLTPDPHGVSGYRNFIKLYKKGLAIERTAVEKL